MLLMLVGLYFRSSMLSAITDLLILLWVVDERERPNTASPRISIIYVRREIGTNNDRLILCLGSLKDVTQLG